ncbi:MAG: hypothetical protein ABI947_16775 [Chloroflexota bacterium]
MLTAVNEQKIKHISDHSYIGQQFHAEGVIFETPSDDPMTFHEMLLLIQDLNPAELQVLGSLIPAYFDGVQHSGKEHVSASWGSPNPRVLRFDIGRSGFSNLSQDEGLRRAELFKSSLAFIQPAQQARSAGNYELASELFEQAMNLMKEQGIDNLTLESMRKLFQI